MLADIDGDRQPVAVYQHALNALGSLCRQSESDVAGLVNATLDDLRKNGVRDETELSVLQHLTQAVPAGQRTDCQSVAAAYAVTREGPA